MKHFPLLLCLLIVGCTDNGVKVSDETPAAATGKISFSLSTATLPQDIASLSFKLVDISYSQTISKSLIVSRDTVMQIVFDQLITGTWHVKIDAKDSTSGIKYTGESDAVVAQGQTTQLNITLHTITTGVRPYSIPTGKRTISSAGGNSSLLLLEPTGALSFWGASQTERFY